MTDKMVSAIQSVTVTAPTFHGVSFNPSYINFFFGANGAGKTSLGMELGQGRGLQWADGTVPENYEILLYNQDFIDLHFKTLNRVKGVFTLSKDGIDSAGEIEFCENERKAMVGQLSKIAELRDEANGKLKEAESNFQGACWRNTKDLREKYKLALKGFTKNPQYSQKISTTSPAMGTPEQIQKLDRAFFSAFVENQGTYSPMTELDGDDHIAAIPTTALLEEEIVSAGNTVFASFIKEIKALDWISEGHRRFHDAADGKCPYCSRKLPNDFEKDFASCFDTAYQEAMKQLAAFQDQYKSHMDIISEIIHKALDAELPAAPDEDAEAAEQARFQANVDLFDRMYHDNLARIESKLAKPAGRIHLEDPTPLLLDINAYIVRQNKYIHDFNEAVAHREETQENCKTLIWRMIAYHVRGELETYQKAQADVIDTLQQLKERENHYKERIAVMEKKIRELGASSTTTQAAIDGINTLLRDSGFQGFEIIKSDETKDAYKVVRQDEGHTVAVRLSEGEKHFLSFLYFYNLVKGCDNNGVRKDRIIIIDDPVSSMDQNALFIISSLIREMVEVCHNNADYREQIVSGNYIKQIFILTHNAYFHKSVTNNQVQRYASVNFYLIRKTANVSSILPCVRPSETKAGEYENFNPIKNAYAALWAEFRELKNEIPLMNVIHRILDWYFIEISGFDGLDLRHRILIDERDKFIVTHEDGTEDPTLLSLANSMLQYMGAGLGDDINYVSDGYTAEQRKEVFRMIFDRMGQIQHYDLMMSRSKDWG